MDWPEWWFWELELSPHLLKRMVDRQFNEVDLRLMLEHASGYHEDQAPDRWVIETIHDKKPWQIIVEPIPEERTFVVVTAFAVH